jgi:adenosine deaminase
VRANRFFTGGGFAVSLRRMPAAPEAHLVALPKVELHVHLEGAIRPETLLKLAGRNSVPLPADDLDGLRQWYTFRDFPHFVEIYMTIARCLRTVDDIELVAREFLQGQAAQNIVHSEVTYTAFTQFLQRGLPLEAQLAAINRARDWAERELGVTMLLIIDIVREREGPEDALAIAEFAIRGHGNGVGALGLGGFERGHPPDKFARAFDRARNAGLPCILHAGETGGAESIWSALRVGRSVRLGHGVRCLEDPALVAHLRAQQIPLEVCPSSNVCLGVAPSWAGHPLPKLMAEGLYLTLNSDDPPMFSTTLTDEYVKAAQTFGWGAETFEQLSLNALRASLLPEPRRRSLEAKFKAEFARLRAGHS